MTICGFVANRSPCFIISAQSSHTCTLIPSLHIYSHHTHTHPISNSHYTHTPSLTPYLQSPHTYPPYLQSPHTYPTSPHIYSHHTHTLPHPISTVTTHIPSLTHASNYHRILEPYVLPKDTKLISNLIRQFPEADKSHVKCMVVALHLEVGPGRGDDKGKHTVRVFRKLLNDWKRKGSSLATASLRTTQTIPT